MPSLNFNAATVPPEEGFVALPAGWYNASIVNSDIKPNKANTGSYLELTLRILDGAYANRQVFDRLNLNNQNQTAVEIAYRRLSAYCHATGVIQLQASEALHGIPLKIKLAIRKDPTGQYEPSNEIKAVKNINEPVEGAAPAFATQPPQAFAPQPPQAAPAWQPPQQAQAPAPFVPPAPQPQAQPAPPFAAQPAQVTGQTTGSTTPTTTSPSNGATPPWVAQQAPAAPAQPAAPAPAQPAAPTGAVPPWAQ